jgi:hypothetical protein
MAAPNLINASSIIGKTSTVGLSTSTTDLLVNPTGSNKVIKVNSVYVANNSAVSDYRTTVIFVRGAEETPIITNSLVPAENTLIVISKEASIYLEEGDSLKISASVNNALAAVISYESIE